MEVENHVYRLESPYRTLFAVCTICYALIGCSVVGPDAIRGGRLAYNEAINETNSQQMLMVPVHNRYQESNQLLAVNSVTANIRISSKAGIQAGFGDSDSYDGNLVPFSGGFVYEENPTISYAPVSGEAYLQQTSSPIPVSLFARISQSLPYPEFAYGMIIASVNGIRNPSFLFGSQQDDPRFDRLVAIMTELTREDCLNWIEDARKGESLSLVLDPTTAGHVERVHELLELLGLEKLKQGNKRLVIPVSLALNNASTDSIAMTTRAIWDLIEILSASVEVPAADEQAGIAASFPQPGRAGRELAIRYARSRPESAYVAVEYREGWFYIDSSDQATKSYFKLLTSLWSAAMASSLGATSAAPVLTIPVSR